MATGWRPALKRPIAVAALLWLVLAGAAVADFPPTAVPEAVGLSSERQARIGARLEADVAAGLLPGALVLVQRRGRRAYFQTFGVQDPDTGAPMIVIIMSQQTARRRHHRRLIRNLVNQAIID